MAIYNTFLLTDVLGGITTLVRVPSYVTAVLICHFDRYPACSFPASYPAVDGRINAAYDLPPGLGGSAMTHDDTYP